MSNDFEWLLFDRIEKIQSINEQYNLLENSYISFSGGKDSTVLHYLVDMALPGNKIPRVFINTGIEYVDIVKFVSGLAKGDDRFHIIKPTQNIKMMLEEYGYPFKSKEHSLKLGEYKKGSRAQSVLNYKNGFSNRESSRFQCPQILQYQYDDSFKLKISDRCCYKLKKEQLNNGKKKTAEQLQ